MLKFYTYSFLKTKLKIKKNPCISGWHCISNCSTNHFSITPHLFLTLYREQNKLVRLFLSIRIMENLGLYNALTNSPNLSRDNNNSPNHINL